MSLRPVCDTKKAHEALLDRLPHRGLAMSCDVENEVFSSIAPVLVVVEVEVHVCVAVELGPE